MGIGGRPGGVGGSLFAHRPVGDAPVVERKSATNPDLELGQPQTAFFDPDTIFSRALRTMVAVSSRSQRPSWVSSLS